jgi:uncharacterized glyoxalase superfamily protein PhnB
MGDIDDSGEMNEAGNANENAKRDASVRASEDALEGGKAQAADVGQAPPPQVWPTLRARDARALIRFLVEAFGFEETAVYGSGDRVQHAELAWPLGGGIMLGSVPADPQSDDSWPLRPGSFGAYVVTDDPDALFRRAVAVGAVVLRELHETDYGSRDFAVADPEGNHWSFGTYRGEPRR